MKIFLVAGARPNFMKIAPIVRVLNHMADAGNPLFDAHHALSWPIVHTGQHYDYEMSQTFFDDLELPPPDFFLDAGSGSHAHQTAKIMTAFEHICAAEKPDWVLVVGDINSTLACAIVAKKAGIKVAHVEAGLRSFDMNMPEEINRMVTDAISDLFFVTEKSGVDNLLREGKNKEQIHFVGHVMVDNLLHQVGRLHSEDTSTYPVAACKPKKGEYAFLTLHRPSNVDHRDTFEGIVAVINRIAEDYKILFPIHPRTRKQLDVFGLQFSDRVTLLSPLGFRESLFLWKDAAFVLTDSGGLQEETTALGVPCLTLRENTERPVTIDEGTNILAGTAPERIFDAYERLKNGNGKPCRIPALWDGRAAERIVDILLTHGIPSGEVSTAGHKAVAPAPG